MVPQCHFTMSTVVNFHLCNYANCCCTLAICFHVVVSSVGVGEEKSAGPKQLAFPQNKKDPAEEDCSDLKHLALNQSLCDDDHPVLLLLQIQLKKILSAVMQKRSGYKLREKRFRFSMGCQVKNPYLRQTSITHDSSLNR